ncbi:hypothetical protein GOODEAATRI_007930 [Goodea atripinnis]|uniref:AB hydrolase-1 domain-containing protein n=1 Tax=Goodea atripinnis TaxID=208336 RepID=A0ABV0MH03_9TELE
MREGFPSLQHTPQDHLDAALRAQPLDPAMRSFPFYVFWLILCASFTGPHLLVLPGMLLEHFATLSMGRGRPQQSGNLRSHVCAGHKPAAEEPEPNVCKCHKNGDMVQESLLFAESTMLTSITDGILCCLTGKTTNLVLPLESSEPSDGFEFVEVKPGRVLRVRHIKPEHQHIDREKQDARKNKTNVDCDANGDASPEDSIDDDDAGTSVHCKRKITVYRNGQLVIENLGDALHSEILQCQDGDLEPCSTVEVELADYKEMPSSPDPNPTPPVPLPSGEQKPAPPPRRRRRKPKRTVLIDSTRVISSCKGTDSDVALFFVHGVGGSLDIWSSQLNFFSRLGYEVIAPDLAGHGASTAPQIAAAYTFYALAEDLRAIFKRYARKRNILIGHSYGAGFARQGAKEKQLLKQGNAFNVSPFVLRAMMSGQYWPEGDEVYHAELTAPILLVHGMCDKFVPMEEDQRMAEVQ